MNRKFPDTDRFPVPEAMRLEHDDIRAGLSRALARAGPVSKAARQVSRFCLTHFEEEEEIVFPILGVLRDLASGNVQPEMAGVLPLISRFSARFDRLGRHHWGIYSSVAALLQAAHRERNREAANLSYRLQLHERLEDEVIYPTVMLMGNYVREKLALR
jgi:hemerythrin HHE cation binding domain-containing protein